MATNSRGANLRVRISADIEDIKRNLALLRGDLSKVKADAARAAPDASAWESSIGRIRGAIGGLAAAYVVVQGISRGIRALFGSLERFDQIDKLAQSSGVSAEALSRLAFAARLSGADINQLAAGLGRLSQDAVKNQGLLGQLGIEILDAAGNARTADALLLDLADVFATLPDGAEKTALAMRLLGRQAGPALVPLLNEGRQGLIDLGLEAERTGNVVGTDAAKAAVEFNDNLERLKSTATGVANTAAQRLLPAFAGYIQALSDTAQNSGVAERAGRGLATAIKGIAAPVILVKNLLEGLINVLLFVGDSALATGNLIGKTLTRSVTGLGDVLLRIAAGQSPARALFDSVGEGARGVGEDAGAALERIRNGFGAMKDGVAEAGRDILAIGKLFDDAGETAPQGVREIGNAAAKASPEAARLLALVRDILGGEGKGGGKSSARAQQIKELADSTVLAQDAAKRAQAALEAQFEDGAISAAQFFAQRLALQQQVIDLQIAQLRSELALTTELDRRRRIEEQLTILQRDRSQAAVDAAREQRQAEAQANAERQRALTGRAGTLTGGLSAAEQSISAQVDAGSLGFLEGERRLREVRDESLAQLRALRAEQAAYLASLAPGDPNLAAAREGLLGIDTAIANVQASMQQLRQDAQDVGVTSLTNFFTAFRDGATSAGDAIRELVADFSRGIFDMFAQATAKRVVGAVSSLFGGGGAGEQGVEQGAVALSGAAAATTVAGTAIAAGATQLSLSAAQLTAAASALAAANAAGAGGGFFGLAHGGGVAGALRMFRGGIDPLVFGAAPRYHGGGIAGLQGNEIPAILQRGETIRTRRQEAALQARLDGNGQAAAPVITSIVVFSEEELAAAMSGKAGEKVYVTHARRNRGAINNA